MIKNELLNYISNKLDIKNKELLEKDLLLHLLLVRLNKNKFFYENFVFKGGTCLTKCYLGYYRFSEDLDFTYINQNYFKDKPTKKIRKEISLIIDKIICILLTFNQDLNIIISEDKSNSKYYEFGANNKFVTFKIWYVSLVTKQENFIKIQINFLELFKYKISLKKPFNLLKDIDKKDFLFLFENMNELIEYNNIYVYDIREILLEKNRAILTRKALKARDFVDIYLILKFINKDIEIFKKKIIEKTIYMLNKYIKYNDNLKLRLNLGVNYLTGDENRLLLKPVDKEFIKFTEELSKFLNSILIVLKNYKLEKT